MKKHLIAGHYTRLLISHLGKYFALSACTLLSGGCTNLTYYAQAINGHMDVIHRSQPISRLIASPNTDPDLKHMLNKAVVLRQFASQELKLPDNRSYTLYADLERPYAVWNVFAAPEFSIKLKQWCFIKAGCVSYRGFFSQYSAERYADRLRAEGYDVYVGGIPAYSTLGWFNDPILNTFIHSELELARLIFHELAHQVVYVPDDTVFNESFATMVEQEGIRRWLTQHGNVSQFSAYQRQHKPHKVFNTLVLKHRKRLEILFATDLKTTEKRAAKTRILNDLHEQFTLLKTARPEFSRYDHWFEQPINNARLATVSIYTQLLPDFQALLTQYDGDMMRFYHRVKSIGKLPKAERIDALKNAIHENR